MEELILKNKEDKETLQDCVVYLLQHCGCFEKDESEQKFCLDVAKKALFLYNLSPKSFGRNKAERQRMFEYINNKISKYEQDEKYHV